MNAADKEHSAIDQEIIEALIKSEFHYLTKRPSWDESGKDGINLITDTEVYDHHDRLTYRELKINLPLLDSLTYDDYILKNQKPLTIDTITDVKWVVRYFSKEEMDTLLKNKDWTEYYQKYRFAPLVAVSRPGLSNDGKLALIYYYGLTGSHSGAGFMIIMKKVGKKWKVKEKTGMWIARYE